MATSQGPFPPPSTRLGCGAMLESDAPHNATEVAGSGAGLLLMVALSCALESQRPLTAGSPLGVPIPERVGASTVGAVADRIFDRRRRRRRKRRGRRGAGSARKHKLDQRQAHKSERQEKRRQQKQALAAGINLKANNTQLLVPPSPGSTLDAALLATKRLTGRGSQTFLVANRPRRRPSRAWADSQHVRLRAPARIARQHVP